MISDDQKKMLVEKHFAGALLMSCERMIGGVSADVYKLSMRDETGAANIVTLRCHGETHDGHEANLEYALLQSLAAKGLPVVDPIAVDSSFEILDCPCLLLKYVEGETASPSENIEAFFQTMAKQLADIHGVSIDGLPWLPTLTSPLPELLDYMPNEPEFGELRRELNSLLVEPYSGDKCLLHCDFWPANLVWRDGLIKGVLDWEDAAIGDRLADVATASLELRYIYGRDGMEKFQAAYSNYYELDEKRLALWMVYVAAAAQCFMGYWRLEKSKEAHMRKTALETIKEAASVALS